MTSVLQPFHLLEIALPGWLNRQQLAVIDYLIEENRVLKEQLKAEQNELARQQLRLEQERNYILQDEIATARSNPSYQAQPTEELLVRAFGQDNVNSLNA